MLFAKVHIDDTITTTKNVANHDVVFGCRTLSHVSASSWCTTKTSLLFIKNMQTCFENDDIINTKRNCSFETMLSFEFWGSFFNGPCRVVIGDGMKVSKEFMESLRTTNVFEKFVKCNDHCEYVECRCLPACYWCGQTQSYDNWMRYNPCDCFGDFEEFDQKSSRRKKIKNKTKWGSTKQCLSSSRMR